MMTVADIGVYISLIGILSSCVVGFVFSLKQRKFPHGRGTNNWARYVWPFISFIAASFLTALGLGIAGVYGSVDQTGETFILGFIAIIGCTCVLSLLLMSGYLLGLWFQGFGRSKD